MAENTKSRLTRMLLSKSRRARFATVFALVAVCVAVVVVVVLHQRGHAATHDEQVLTCPVTDVVAHTHDESCYDADGNLVCTLPERELHTHTEECYTQTHELTCGMEESEEHTHTDDCYTVTEELTCGKEENTEEHVHGPGCFTTVTVHDDVETESEAGNEDESADAAMPAQTFDDTIMDEDGNVWAHVVVNAPEGAFPANTTMSIAPLDAESVRDKVEDALRKDDQNVIGAKQMKAVDITFYDERGNKIEPAIDVEVRITTDTVLGIAEPVVVHVDNDQNKDAEVMQKVDLVNQDEQDTSTGSEDTLRFQTDGFSTYVIVEIETKGSGTIMSQNDAYTVSVSYDTDAGIPMGATLQSAEVPEGADYNAYASTVAQALDKEAQDLNSLRVFTITIQNAQGTTEVKPTAPVKVVISYAEGVDKEQEFKVVDFVDGQARVIDPLATGAADMVDTFTFTTDSPSVCAIAACAMESDEEPAEAPTTEGEVVARVSDLDGRTNVAIVHLSTVPVQKDTVGNNKRFLGQALQATPSTAGGLAASNVVMEKHVNGQNLVTSNKNGVNNSTGAVIDRWTFEYAGTQDQYYIRMNDAYLAVVDGQLVTSETPYAFAIEAGTGNNDGLFRLRTADGNYVCSSVARTKASDNTNTPHFTVGPTGDNTLDDTCWLTFYDADLSNTSDLQDYWGRKISAQSLASNNEYPYLIYQNVYNSTTEAYEDYVVLGDGTLAKAYDKGDQVTLYCDASTTPLWYLTVVEGSDGAASTYVFHNKTNNTVLCPSESSAVLTAEESDTHNGVILSARREGSEAYNSTIEHQDAEGITWGLRLDNDGTGNFTLGSETSEFGVFSFATTAPEANVGHDNLPIVATVSNSDIHMYMFDYNERADIANVTGSDGYAVGVLQSQHVAPKLSEAGYPYFTKKKQDGATLFDPESSPYYVGTADGLFLASVYDATGYYEYSCYNNFAEYDRTTGTFTVYDALGSPNTLGSKSKMGDKFSFRRGNFFPYNVLDTSKQTNNQYSGNGYLLDYSDPATLKPVYGFTEDPDHYFGMTMDFQFNMPKNGTIDGNPLIFDFNGDDDLWIYFDGVLVLDIGGVHNAWPGSIDLSTGAITLEGRGDDYPRTIKACFKKAEVFPDGSPWDESKVDQYFRGETFVSYGNHSFNMFYMEHGASASNLQVRFNLPTVEPGTVTLTKKLDKDIQTEYGKTQEYAFQAFKLSDDGTPIPITDVVHADKDGSAVTLYDNVKLSSGATYDNVFYLKPNESVVLRGIADEQEYYVQEIGVKVKDKQVDQVYVNDDQTVQIGDEADNEAESTQDGIYKSTAATPGSRGAITFTNPCDERDDNELHVTKRLAEGVRDENDAFTFKIELEGSDGKLAPYVNGTYYVRDSQGNYYKPDDNGKLGPNGRTAAVWNTDDEGVSVPIPADYTIVVPHLLTGVGFQVTEMDVREPGKNLVSLADSEWAIQSKEVAECDDGVNANGTSFVAGSIAQGKDAEVTFTNTISRTSMVQLQKVSEKGKELSEATFTLARKTGEDSWHTYDINIKAGTTTLNDLREGTYRLQETAAPNDYVVMSKYAYFKVYKENGAYKVSITDEAGNPTTDPDGIVSMDSSDANTVVIKIKNLPGSALPQTGGTGTMALYAVSGIGAVGAMVYLLRRKRTDK